MAEKVIKIERAGPRDGIIEDTARIAKGYCIGDPGFGEEKLHANNAVFVKTLDEQQSSFLEDFLADGEPREGSPLVHPRAFGSFETSGDD